MATLRVANFCLIILVPSGWKRWSTPRAVSQVQEILLSWFEATAPTCALCGTVGIKQLFCPGCDRWTCLVCGSVDKCPITKVGWCVDCRVARLLPFRTVTEDPTYEWLQIMAKLSAGALSLSFLGGSFRFRDSPIHNLLHWGAYWCLEVLPGSPVVYEQWIVHRLLVQGVSIATVEQDFIAISVLHSSLKALIPGLCWHNPTRQDLVRVFVKHLGKEVKLSADCTVPVSACNFVMMINSLDSKIPMQLHTKIVLQTLGLGGLRRVAAKAIYMVRHPPALYSVDFDFLRSDVVLQWVDGFGLCVGLCIDTDKNIPAGRKRWVWIPGVMIMGLTFGMDIYLWLTTYGVPDGPFLACPTGPNASGFNPNQFTAFDRAFARAWLNTFPDDDSRTAPGSLRKMIIQALHDSMRLLQKFTERDIGEFIGWISTKGDIQKHYAGLGQLDMLQMLHDLDPSKLPSVITTAGVGPKVWKKF